jgi:type III restriction enzyme
MSQVAIDNPVINAPFMEPQRHFRFDENGITHEILTGRRHRRVASRDPNASA